MLKTTLRVFKVSLGLSPILRDSRERQANPDSPNSWSDASQSPRNGNLTQSCRSCTALLELCYVWLLRQFEIVTTTGSRRVDVVFNV